MTRGTRSQCETFLKDITVSDDGKSGGGSIGKKVKNDPFQPKIVNRKMDLSPL